MTEATDEKTTVNRIVEEVKDQWRKRFGGINFDFSESGLKHVAGLALDSWRGKDRYTICGGDPQGEPRWYDDVSELTSSAYDIYRILGVCEKSPKILIINK